MSASRAGPEIRIRPAVSTDEAAVRACAQAAYARYVPSIGREPAPMVADFAAQIAAGQVHVAVDATGDVLGFVVFHPVKGHVLLENVAVFPRATGCGIGRTLIAHCEGAARRLGLGAVHLYTNEKMSENLRLYPRLGYAEVARRHEDGFDRVFFVKQVA